MSRLFLPKEGESVNYAESSMRPATREMFRKFREAGYGGKGRIGSGSVGGEHFMCPYVEKNVCYVGKESIKIVVRIYDSDRPRAVASADFDHSFQKGVEEDPDYRKMQDAVKFYNRKIGEKISKMIGEKVGMSTDVHLTTAPDFQLGLENHVAIESYDADRLIKTIEKLPDTLYDLGYGLNRTVQREDRKEEGGFLIARCETGPDGKSRLVPPKGTGDEKQHKDLN